MRKLLMATAAMVGASLGMANASQIELATPTGLTQSSQGTNLPIYAPQAPSPAAPQPGQIVVRIDLRENMYAVGGWSSLDSVNGNKQQPYGIIGYPRFYLGFDGKAANGLTYGMFWEIRNGANPRYHRWQRRQRHRRQCRRFRQQPAADAVLAA